MTDISLRLPGRRGPPQAASLSRTSGSVGHNAETKHIGGAVAGAADAAEANAGITFVSGPGRVQA
jgi:hypothetical protein